MKIKKGNNYQCIKTGVFKTNNLDNKLVEVGTVLYCDHDNILLLPDDRWIHFSGDASEFFERYMTPEEIRHWKDVRERAAISALPASIEWVGSLLKHEARRKSGTRHHPRRDSCIRCTTGRCTGCGT